MTSFLVRKASTFGASFFSDSVNLLLLRLQLGDLRVEAS